MIYIATVNVKDSKYITIPILQVFSFTVITGLSA